jgi:hypothetical protein
MGGLTLPEGVYKFDAAAELTGALTLNAKGDPNAVWVFQIGSSLQINDNSYVKFVNDFGNADFVYWQVGTSAVLEKGANVMGNFMADQSVTVKTGGVVLGRTMARIAAVSLDVTTITKTSATESSNNGLAGDPVPTLSPSAAPTVVGDTNAPTSAPVVKDDSNDDGCFAASESVLLESGVSVAISDVQVGDMVQVVAADGSLKFSEVVFLPHGANMQKATFSELELASGNSLRATPAHFVLAGACGANAFELTAMKDIIDGSCVQTASGEDEVTGNGLVFDHGIYTIVTKESSGLVVVNGVRASSFANNHWLVNKYYNIHRALYEVAPSLMKNRDVIAANLIVGDIAMSL